MPREIDNPSFLPPHLIVNYDERQNLRCPECRESLYFEIEHPKRGHHEYTAICKNAMCEWSQRVEHDENTKVLISTPPGPQSLFPLDGHIVKQKKHKLRNTRWNGVSCALANCNKRATTRSLCPGHYNRWLNCGGPDMTDWIQSGALTPKRWRRARRSPTGSPVAPR